MMIRLFALMGLMPVLAEDLKTTEQNQGDLVKTKAVITEIDRFQKEKSPPARPVSVLSGISTTKQDLYMVVDLKGGADAKSYPVSYLSDESKSGWTDEYKTDKLVLRRIEPGTFDMGSPEDEKGRQVNEIQHKVTLSKAFYIGVFEVTQRQWELVMGHNPSNAKVNSALHPVEKVSYLDIRGLGDGANWPANNRVEPTSFMGKLRARTGKVFDLPTEAQWEYACRAGTTGGYSGKGDLADMAWYRDNAIGKTHPVGQKRANAWGVYDMHGNVWEWCLDWMGPCPGTATDPLGAASGSARVRRGGCWNFYAVNCRSALRSESIPPSRYHDIGFRAASTLP